MYESKISNAKWIAYDLPGNIGWISFLTALLLCFLKKPELMSDGFMALLLILDSLCAAVMLVGIGELISERIQRLDRVLPKKRLYRGFGALTFSSLAGSAVSLIALVTALIKGLDAVPHIAVLCGGGFLCFVFCGLLLKEYKKR